jgi:hypothetical protein
MNKLKFILFAIASTLYFSAADAVNAQAKQSVRLAGGTGSTSFRGVLKGQAPRYADCMVRASARQTIDVRLDGKSEAEFVILRPETLENVKTAYDVNISIQ